MKLYITVTPSGTWRAETSSGRWLYAGTIGPAGDVYVDEPSSRELPPTVERAIHRAHLTQQVVSVAYSPETAPKMGL